MKLSKDRDISISFSAISTFMDCRRKYWWSYVKRYEPIVFAPQFITGNCVHFGLYQLYDKNPKAVRDTLKIFDNEKQKLRDKLSLDTKQESDLNQEEYMIRGMLEAYAHKYRNHIKKVKHITNELKLKYKIDRHTKLTIKMDNIVLLNNRRHVHEIKTTKTLTPDYVKNIKNDMQTAIYFHGHNRCMPKSERLRGIMYDVIRKPSIRKKKKESTQQFLKRLADYYDGPNENELFYMEVIERPLLTDDRVFDVIEHVVDDMRNCATEDDFYPNDRHCYVYKRCHFYDICHYGENAATRAKFRVREKQGD